MNINLVDKLVLDDDWSDLTRFQEMPQIDLERMSRYRMARLRQQVLTTEDGYELLTTYPYEEALLD
jgi:hypothetical protein